MQIAPLSEPYSATYAQNQSLFNIVPNLDHMVFEPHFGGSYDTTGLTAPDGSSLTKQIDGNYTSKNDLSHEIAWIDTKYASKWPVPVTQTWLLFS